MSYDAHAHVEWMKHWVGWHEGPNNWNPFSIWQGLDSPHYPWCASFADEACCEGGGFRWPDYCTFGRKGDAFVPYIVNHAKRMGIWRDKHWRAHPGAQVIYDWSGTGAHAGNEDHVETVVQDDGVRCITIGGNTSDSVLYRTRDRKYIAGFAALDAAGQSGPIGGIPAPIPQPKPKSVHGGENMLMQPHKQGAPYRPPCVFLDEDSHSIWAVNGANFVNVDGTKSVRWGSSYMAVVPTTGGCTARGLQYGFKNAGDGTQLLDDHGMPIFDTSKFRVVDERGAEFNYRWV